MIFGEYDGAALGARRSFPRGLPGGRHQCRDQPDIRRAIWEKYVFLVGLSGADHEHAQDARPDPCQSEDAAGFLFDLVHEATAVGRAHGVALAGGFCRDAMAFADSLPAEMTSSMFHDLDRGRPLELRWLSGGVCDLGAAAGVPTPVNRAVDGGARSCDAAGSCACYLISSPILSTIGFGVA